MKIKMLAAAAVLALGATTANAAVNIYISNTDNGVFAQVVGSLDLTGLTSSSQATSSVGVRGGVSDGPYGFLGTGLANKTQDGYTGMTGPVAFGDTLFSYASSGTGDAFGLQLNGLRLYVPAGYTSGTAINSTATWQYKTLADLELTTGTYAFTLPSDQITLHVGEAAPVPEPGEWAMMAGGLGLVGAFVRRRQRKA